MGTRSSYAPGTFSYVELSTTDSDGAKAFYAGLFGWDYQDVPIPEEAGGGTYSLCKLGDETVAGLTPQPDQQREAGVPPHWFNYITVASADDVAERVKELGGSVHAGPFDVMDQGRMAVIADPQGAMFGAWEPRASIGTSRVNDPGCLTWNELATSDVDGATEFYKGLFGWTSEELDTGGGPRYSSIKHDGAADGLNGGIRELAPEQVAQGVPPSWMPYFVAESADGTAGKAGELGGSVVFGPIDLPTDSRIAVLHDPQGAFFAIFEGETAD